MISKVLINALRQVELFGELSPMQITEIARNAERIMYPAGAIIAKAGDSAPSAILLIDGQVDCITTMHPPMTSRLVAGTLIAEMAMFTPFEHGATFVARSPVKAMRIPRQAMLAQMAEDPGLAERFVKKVAGRLRHVVVEMARISGLDVDDGAKAA
jgi:CRP-like cAMP-binding protein